MSRESRYANKEYYDYLNGARTEFGTSWMTTDRMERALVQAFADEMDMKLKSARRKGRDGWDNPKECTVDQLKEMMMKHIEKGDMRDVANFAMFIHYRIQGINEEEPTR
jgi:hypothetical protein